MATQAVKQWLSDRFTSAITAAPGTYPQDAVSGLLYTIGFTSANTQILLDQPAEFINLSGGSLAVILDDPQEDEHQITYGGAYGNIENDFQFSLEIYWVADFTGDPANSIPPPYVSQVVSNRYWRKLLETVRAVVRLCGYQLTAAGAGNARQWTWALTDADTGRQSSIKGPKPEMKVQKVPLTMTENSNNYLYQALIEFTVIEIFKASGL